jgi:ubiquinone/menaquinone biosynthesis C-methylase UbiE
MSADVTKEQLDAGRGYEALFVPALVSPWTRHLVRGAEIVEGRHVLDVACGSGVLTRHARAVSGSGGRVVGLDPAPGMIAAAAEIEPEVEWVSGSAESLPFDEGAFDCVVSQFGMMFFADRDAAAAEMLRVARPGGRLAVAVWNALEHNPAYGDVIAVLDDIVGTDAGDAVRLPFRLGDAREAAAHFERAGFGEIRVETLAEQARFPSARTMVEAEVRGWLPLCGIHLEAEEIAEVFAGADARLARYVASSGEAVFPTSAHVITATKPG